MTSPKKHFYLTTPLYYGTAKPHLGSLYSTLIADVITRWQRLCGHDVFFLTGTDEHGQKIEQAAAQASKDPKSFVDSFIPAYKDTWSLYDIKYDYFMRTTDPYHRAVVQQFVERMLAQGDIYKDRYVGWYCTPCETFVTGKDEVQEEKEPLCPSCGRKTGYVEEESYFFRLSAYADKLLQFYKGNPYFIVPKERANEVISFVESGLKDLSISRTTVAWGIPFPEDDRHIVYVWVEALCGYITGIGCGQPDRQELFNKWWPADVHVIGKDIVRFHAVYWPALLMALDLPLPKSLLVHGWIKVNQQKMSKSFGNVVDPVILQQTYGTDAIRYYLLRYMAVNQDGDFSTADLAKSIESDLANDLGNLLNRAIMLAEKNGMMTLQAPQTWPDQERVLLDEVVQVIMDVSSYMQEYQFHLALARVWKCIHAVNAYFHANEPWKLAQSAPAQCATVLSATMHALRVIATLLWPFMPNKMVTMLTSLGVPRDRISGALTDLTQDSWQHTFELTKVPALFEKPEIKEEPSMTIQQAAPEVAAQDNKEIGIEEFIKVELVVGTVVSCEQMSGSDKLLKMQVDFGSRGVRQILSGIAKSYAPEDLITKQCVFVFNLKPRKMMGTESQGMLLTASDKDGRLQLIHPSSVVENGTQLK